MDPYNTIARYYDLEHDGFVDDVEFYRQFVADGPILEVGAGTGRIMQGLAQDGQPVVGIDPSAAMTELGRVRLRGLRNANLITGTLESLPVGAEFETVILPLNVLWHADALDSQLDLLAAVRRHCAPGARVALDLSNPYALADKGSRGAVRERFRRATHGGEVRCWSTCWDDEAEQVLELSLVYDEVVTDGGLRRSFADLRLRYVFAAELELMLRATGFAMTQRYGSYDLDEYTAASPTLLVVAETRS